MARVFYLHSSSCLPKRTDLKMLPNLPRRVFGLLPFLLRFLQLPAGAAVVVVVDCVVGSTCLT